MAKKSRQDELFDMLRARGLRKGVARRLSDAVAAADKRSPQVLKDAASDLRSLAQELEDRITGGPAKRRAAAQKGARTRKRTATARSAAAKRGAATRARSSSAGTRSTRSSSSSSSSRSGASGSKRSSGGTRSTRSGGTRSTRSSGGTRSTRSTRSRSS